MPKKLVMAILLFLLMKAKGMSLLDSGLEKDNLIVGDSPKAKDNTTEDVTVTTEDSLAEDSSKAKDNTTEDNTITTEDSLENAEIMADYSEDLVEAEDHNQGWKFMSCSHCQELDQQV